MHVWFILEIVLNLNEFSIDNSTWVLSDKQAVRR